MGTSFASRQTWLLQAFADRVADRARVFLGTCEDLVTPRTLGLFRDMARDEGGALGGVPGRGPGGRH